MLCEICCGNVLLIHGHSIYFFPFNLTVKKVQVLVLVQVFLPPFLSDYVIHNSSQDGSSLAYKRKGLEFSLNQCAGLSQRCVCVCVLAHSHVQR